MKKTLLTLFLTCSVLLGFGQDTYILSSDSKLTIDGTSTIHDWTVTANTLEGTLTADGTSPKKIDFLVTVADILSERGATMDKKTHNALKKETSPKVMFSLKEVKNGSAFVGALTVAGKQRDVEIAGKMEASGDKFKISGEYPITLQDFDIEPPTAMFGQIVVGNDVTVKFDLVFTK